MTKTDIIAELAKNKTVEEIINNIAKGSFEDTDELAQDLYLELLEKDEEMITKLHDKNQMNYFITTMVKNNLLSFNSRYYYNYGRWNRNRSTFEGEIDPDE